MNVAALAELELVRATRRSDAVFALLLMSLLGLAPAVALMVVLADPDAFWGEVSLAPARGLPVLVDFVMLPLLAHALAFTSLRQELRRGSWRLLLQAPLSEGRVLLGKAIGVGVTVVLAQALFALGLSATIPFTARSAAAASLEILLPLALALAMVPTGLAEALVAERGSGQAAFRALNVAQWIVPVAAFVAAVPGSLIERADAVVATASGCFVAPLSEVVAQRVANPTTLLLVVLLVEAGLALLAWHAFVSRRRWS